MFLSEGLPASALEAARCIRAAAAAAVFESMLVDGLPNAASAGPAIVAILACQALGAGVSSAHSLASQ